MTRALAGLLCLMSSCAWAGVVPERELHTVSAHPDKYSAARNDDAVLAARQSEKNDAGYVLAVADEHEAAWEHYQAAHDAAGRQDNGLCR